MTQIPSKEELLKAAIFVTKLRQCNVLHLSVIFFRGGDCLWSRGCLPPPSGRHPCWADTPPGQTPPWQTHPFPGQTPPWADTPQADTPGQTPPWQTPRAQCMLGYTPPAQCVLGNSQQAGGTHPTGMHACSKMLMHCLFSNLKRDLHINFKMLSYLIYLHIFSI